MMTREGSAASRCAEIEEQIAKCNSQLRDLQTQEPESEKALQQLRASQDWVQVQRDKLVAQRVDLEKALALERCAEAEAACKELSPESARLSKIVAEAERAIRDAEAQRDRLRWQNEERQRALNIAAREVQIFQEPRFEADRRERLEPLRARLLSL